MSSLVTSVHHISSLPGKKGRGFALQKRGMWPVLQGHPGPYREVPVCHITTNWGPEGLSW
jgi:hypothetical protein